MSEDTPQIPVDAPQPEDRVDMVSPVEEQDAPEPAPAAAAPVNEHPELVVAGAFAGAFVFAKLLRRISGA